MALPAAVPSARLHTRLVACEWGLTDLAATAELVTSELVTNGVRASEGLTGSRYDGVWLPGKPPIRLWLKSDHGRILVQVWDADHQLPVRRKPAPDDPHGRGLLLVETFAAECGVYRPVGSSGKTVWAIVAK